MGFEIMLSPDIGRNDRETYDLLSYLGDLGGLIEILRMLLRLFAVPFSTLRMQALLTNRLYHVSQDTRDIVEKIKEATIGEETNKLRERENGDIEFDVPKWLDWELLWNRCCCFIRKKGFQIYKE